MSVEKAAVIPPGHLELG